MSAGDGGRRIPHGTVQRRLPQGSSRPRSAATGPPRHSRNPAQHGRRPQPRRPEGSLHRRSGLGLREAPVPWRLEPRGRARRRGSGASSMAPWNGQEDYAPFQRTFQVPVALVHKGLADRPGPVDRSLRPAVARDRRGKDAIVIRQSGYDRNMRRMDTDRRTLLRGIAGGAGLLAGQSFLPAWAQTGSPGLRADMPTLAGPEVRLTVGHSPFTVGGRTGHAFTVNGTLPAPLIRLREGQTARLSVTNTLDEDTSIHWHGLLAPVPDGRRARHQLPRHPGAVKPSSVRVPRSSSRAPSGIIQPLQPSGGDGPLRSDLIIDPANADPVAYEREHVHGPVGLEFPASAR